MNNLKFKKIALLFVLTIIGVLSVYSQQQLTGSAITNGAVVEVLGDRYNDCVNFPNPATRPFYVERSYGLIMLSSANLYQLTGLTGQALVTVTIDYEVESAGGFYYPASVTQQLELSASGNKVIDAAYFKAEGAQHIKATITSTSIPGSWVAANAILKLEATVVTESFNILNFNAISSVNLNHTTPLTQAGNLLVSWSPIIGAQAYDLEWTYVSDQGENGPLNPMDIEVDRFLFRNNSSRVEVTGNSFEIPLMYEKGYIVYRLRAAGKRVANGVVTNAFTEWSTPDGLYSVLGLYPSANLYQYAGLEKNMNWQSSLTFAEEGKHKEVIAFHDGSMRNRQAVTRINTDQRSVVGETFYDYNGKPVIQVLPAPTTQNLLNYFPQFNIVEGQTQLQKQDYSVMNQGQGCAIISPDLSTNSGASQYYSPQNPFTNSTTNNTGTNMLNRNSVPNADKKPYTQTKYTSDNTGKISAQSGVGSTHILGSDHETKYLYGTPQQEELTRLFGNQVGYNVHYKKDVTVDANGQVSVTYKNLGDKVIATTITGSAPTNLTELDGDKTKEINSDLLGIDGSANKLSTDKTTKTLSTTITVPSDNDYKFDYSGILGSYNLTCINPNTSSTNFDGAVDLTIQLIDGCGTVIFSANDPADVTHTNVGNSGSTQPLSLERQNLRLEQGDYNLTKTVTVNEQKLDQYWNDYLASPSNCFKDKETFITEEKARLDLIGCDLTCEKCEAQILIMKNSGLYGALELEKIDHLCDEICDKEIGCTNYIYSMLGDMSIGGQYAEVRKNKLNISSPGSSSPGLDSDGNPTIEHPDVTFDNADTDNPPGDAGDPADNTIDEVSFPLSIFNASNSLPISTYINIPGIRAHWRNPLQITLNPAFPVENRKNEVLLSNVSLAGASYSVTDYKDENGDIIYAYVYRDASDPTKFKPSVIPSVIGTSLLTEVDLQTLLYKIPIKYLANVADFEGYWKAHFANYLLPYHPEYGYLVECTDKYRLSNDFDYQMGNTEECADAKDKFYISSGTTGQPIIVGATSVASKDPFLTASIRNFKYMKQMNDTYKPGTSMAVQATSMVNCEGNTPSYCPPTVGICDDGIIDTDEEWGAYKGLYLSAKQQLIKNESMKTAVDNFYYNGCIGEPDFYTTPDAYYFRDKDVLVSTTIVQHVCHYNWLSFVTFERNCIDVPVTYNKIVHPYIDPRQVCYVGTANLFANKSKRFFLNFSANSPIGQMPSNCENEYDDVDDNIVVPIPCDDALIEFGDQQKLEAERYKFESCGLCPFASDVEGFIMNMLDSNYIEAPLPTPKHLTCSNDGVELGGQLFAKLVSLNSGSADISWSTTVSNPVGNSKVLEGNFISGTNTIATLRLVIPPLTTLPANVQFNDLSKLCCLKVTKGITGSNEGKLFTMDAQYTDPDNNKKVNFTVEGSFTERLDICDITPNCITTDDSRRVANFLNMLVVTSEDKTNELVTNGSTNNLLGVSDLKDDYYMQVIRSVIKKDNDMVYGGYADDNALESYVPKWTSLIVNNTLTASLDYTIGTEAKTLVIDLSCLSTIDFTQIKSFSRIRPFSGDATKFYVDALIFKGTKPSENVYKTIEIYVPNLKPTVCEQAHPLEN